MSISRSATPFILLMFSASVFADALVTVPGQSDPYLAGMPNGSTASAAPDGSNPDVAPVASPSIVPLSVTPAAPYFFVASGAVSYSEPVAPSGPDGNTTVPTYSHLQGAQNGIGDLTSPLSALVGVFLGPARPDLDPPPPGLDFSVASTRDFLSLAPALKQPFFIGDGVSGASNQQVFFAPPGATRLFLGAWDQYAWADNTGSFSVRVSATVLGDVNRDGRVDFADLLTLAQHYGRSQATWSQGNLNTDSTVDFSDLLLLAQHYGQSGPAAPLEVPEPGILMLLVICTALPRARIQTGWRRRA